jgi:hypothetical protein
MELPNQALSNAERPEPRRHAARKLAHDPRLHRPMTLNLLIEPNRTAPKILIEEPNMPTARIESDDPN